MWLGSERANVARKTLFLGLISGRLIDIAKKTATIFIISLRSTSETGSMTVTISDLLGREMLRKEMPNGGQLDVESLPSGLYIVHAVSEDGKVFRGKLEKEQFD